MHRWHGLVDGGSDNAATNYRVTLKGVPLDADDGARIEARLSDAHWPAQRVRDALVLGLRLGAGQVWPPDRGARVEVLRFERGADSALTESLVLTVVSTLDRAALEQRLLQLFADDRLIDPVVESL